jgi:diaminopimelate decarboxylase
VIPLANVLPLSAGVTSAGHLTAGGCDLVELAETYGTPLYVYDEETIRSRALAYRDALAAAYPGPSLVAYAAKALCAPWLLRLLAALGLGLDVASGGELFVAGQSGFPLDRVYVHGNNKSERELRQALEAGVGRIVVDNLDEIERLARLTEGRSTPQPVLLRVTPGVEAHTHEYIKTGIVDTKFGLSIETGAAEEGVRALARVPGLRLVGLHAHIGSQIFELEPYAETIRRVLGFGAPLFAALGLELRELSPGGGYGVSYTADDDPPSPREAVRVVAAAVTRAAAEEGLGLDETLPRLTLEPGRSIVGPAGVALYRVGSIKRIPGVRTYVAVDGGMADNIRPTTYGAVYSALLANRADAAPITPAVALAGAYCESGDILVREAHLPDVAVGDLVALPTSGAYNLAMASNYNLALRPPIVVVRDGTARLARRRETYEDLIRSEE